MAVHALQLQPLLSRHVTVELFEIGYLLVEALTHHVNVAGYAVLSGTGDIERDQVATEAVLPPSVEMVSNVVGDKRIRSSRVTGRHSS